MNVQRVGKVCAFLASPIAIVLLAASAIVVAGLAVGKLLNWPVKV